MLVGLLREIALLRRYNKQADNSNINTSIVLLPCKIKPGTYARFQYLFLLQSGSQQFSRSFCKSLIRSFNLD